MPTTGVINGTNLRLYADGNPIGTATSCTLSFSKELRETIHKDNVSGYAANESGKKSYSISFEGFATEDTSLNTVTVNSMPDVFDLFNQDAAFAWKFTTDVVGDTQWAGNGIMSEFSVTAAVEENSTISGSITGTGAVAKTVIA